MIQSNYTVKILEPENNGYLTQAEEVGIQDRIISKKVFLAVNDSPKNWKEITEEEADAIIAEKERIAKDNK